MRIQKREMRSEMSKAAFDAHREGVLRVTAGRGSDFFGPWGLPTAAMGERTFYPLLNGKAANLIGEY